ncbi:MAG: HDIG domain-containing protein [Desulfobacterales bacterium]|nr:HDIG domain-containing protein [Desulfobacterales bacterium]
MKKTKSEDWLNSAGDFFLTRPHLLWFMALAVTLIFTVFQVPEQQSVTVSYQVGDVAQRDVKAPNDFFIQDEEVTLQKKDQAKSAVKIVYDFDPGLLRDIQTNIDDALKISRSLFPPPGEVQADGTPTPDPTLAMVLETQPRFQEKLGIELSKGEFTTLYKHRFSPDIGQRIDQIMEKILSNGVVANKKVLLEEEDRGIQLRNIESGEEKPVNNLKVFYGPDQAKAMVRIEGQPLLKETNGKLSSVIVNICQGLLQPNITLNRNETQNRILEAQAAIKPVMYQIKAGEMIIREGERVDKKGRIKLDALKAQAKEEGVYTALGGIALMTFALLMVTYILFLRDHHDLQKKHNKHMIFLALGLLLHLCIVEIAVYIAAPAAAGRALATTSFYTALPLQSAAMIACLFLGFDIAIYFTLVLTILTTVSFGGNFEVFIFFFLSSIIAAYWTRERQKRQNFIMAGFKLALFNALLAMVLGFNSLEQAQLIILAEDMGMAFVGGLFAATLTVGFTPLIEVLFDYTTEIKLLEFANLDQPLIKKLMIEAPGTYNHSVIVATLSEAAASNIHASALKARVMGYYHDIGKLDKPMYFIENQADGKNRHDKLSPSMSALILIQHVKKGVELAKKYKLGDEIIEGIVQHHGTSLIKYFYNKSLAMGNENVNEEDFRYPGPKPQTREAGIVMLADVVEAAVRALERPTPARIQGRVKELINHVFADGQLEECELTLKDLHQIAKSFNNILTSIYHSRIEYTDKPQEKKKEKNGTSKDTDRQSAKGEGGNPAAPQKDRTDLKRLGL